MDESNSASFRTFFAAEFGAVEARTLEFVDCHPLCFDIVECANGFANGVWVGRW